MSIEQIRGRITFEGITLLVLGAVAILAPLASTYVATFIIGILLVADGILRVLHGLEHQYRPGIGWLVASSILYVGAGAVVLWAPFLGASSLTPVVGAFFVLSAVAKAIRAYQVRDAGATSWLLFDAIISAFLGVFLFIGLPSMGFWGLGIIVGVDLIIGGTTLIGMLSRAKGAPSR
jgi:uncharacterized membrane protein HdeD (DUF308 family)